MSQFKEKIVSLLKERGISNPLPEHVAVFTDNISGEARISYNFTSTNIRLPKSEVSKQETEEAGFKWWPTWSFIEK